MRYVLLTSFCLVALLGCGGSDKANPAPTQTQDSTPNTEKVYTVLTYPRYAPYQYFDEQGNIIGFDVDMIHAIAKNQNLAIQIKETNWVGMLDELNTGKGDLVISGISRQQAGGDTKYTLSNAYLHGRDAIMTKEDVTHINTMNDMVTGNMVAQASTIFAEELAKRKGENSPTLKLTETSFLAFKEVASGNVEAVYAHENILRHYAKGQPQLKFRFSGTGEGFELYDMVVVVKKGNTELIDKINAGIKAVHGDGTYQALHVKWFGANPPNCNVGGIVCK